MTRQDIIDNWSVFQEAFQNAGVSITLAQGLQVFDELTGSIPQDAIDLHTVSIERSPNVTDWPIKTLLTATKDGGNFRFNFDPNPPESWKWYTGNPDSPSDNIQYTLWAIRDGIACAFIQYWQGREQIFESPLTNWKNWWGPEGSVTNGVFGDYIPSSGDKLGLFVSAGNARGRNDITSVTERSNVVIIEL